MTTAERAQLDRDVQRVERDYDRALKSRRGDGLAELGAELHRLYARQRHAGPRDGQQSLFTTTTSRRGTTR